MIKFKEILQEDIGNTPTEETAIRTMLPRITTQQWNRLFFTPLQSLNDDEFQMLQQLSTYLYNRYLTYSKNPKLYNKKLAAGASTVGQ
jgi:hypothetical protein